MLTKDDLIEFETKIAESFNRGEIYAPVHLHAGNEEQLIEIFQRFQIGEDDWVVGSWRSHYHCLLKGVPQAELMQACLAGRSISLCFEKQKVVCSGIVGGSIPIGVGIALGLKRSSKKGRIFVFSGDMTAETGIMHESMKYAKNWSLPIRFIIEDNNKSVCTDTRATWNADRLTFQECDDRYMTYYRYEFEKYPHAGAGKRVQF